MKWSDNWRQSIRTSQNEKSDKALPSVRKSKIKSTDDTICDWLVRHLKNQRFADLAIGSAMRRQFFETRVPAGLAVSARIADAKLTLASLYIDQPGITLLQSRWPTGPWRHRPRALLTLRSCRPSKYLSVPEAITQGDTLEEARAEAADALLSAMDFYFEDKRPVPPPSKSRKGEELVALPVSVSAKILLLNEMIAQRVTPSELARRLNTRPQDVNRIVDISHATKIDTIAAPLEALGKRIEIAVV